MHTHPVRCGVWGQCGTRNVIYVLFGTSEQGGWGAAFLLAVLISLVVYLGAGVGYSIKVGLSAPSEQGTHQQYKGGRVRACSFIRREIAHCM